MMKRLVIKAVLMLAAAAPATAQVGRIGSTVAPGMWEITTTISGMRMPNLPPAAAAAMRRPTVIRHCITPEEAARGPQEMMKRDKSCRFTRYSAAGGLIDAVMSCSQPGGAMTVRSRGRYTPTSFSTTADMAMTGAHPMTLSAQASGRRTGGC